MLKAFWKIVENFFEVWLYSAFLIYVNIVNRKFYINNLLRTTGVNTCLSTDVKYTPQVLYLLVPKLLTVDILTAGVRCHLGQIDKSSSQLYKQTVTNDELCNICLYNI